MLRARWVIGESYHLEIRVNPKTAAKNIFSEKSVPITSPATRDACKLALVVFNYVPRWFMRRPIGYHSLNFEIVSKKPTQSSLALNKCILAMKRWKENKRKRSLKPVLCGEPSTNAGRVNMESWEELRTRSNGLRFIIIFWFQSDRVKEKFIKMMLNFLIAALKRQACLLLLAALCIKVCHFNFAQTNCNFSILHSTKKIIANYLAQGGEHLRKFAIFKIRKAIL